MRWPSRHRASAAPLDALVSVLRPYLAGQRWFPATADPGTLAVVQFVELAGDEFGSLLATCDGLSAPLLQLPVHLSYLPPERMGEQGWIGAYTDAEGQARYAREGLASPAFLAHLLAGMGLQEGGLDPERSILSQGEQSNSSVIVPSSSTGPGTIIKAFRLLEAGPNPEVEVGDALTARGWSHAPALLGAWQAREATGRRRARHPEARLDLAVASEYIPEATDGFDLAKDRQDGPDSFATLGRELADVVAQLHGELASLGTAPSPPGAKVAARLVRTFDWACAQAPQLQEHRAAHAQLAAHIAMLDNLPQRQRIHGDLHLGQALHSPTRGWILLDFEGEPLRPLEQRRRPDFALRDVAGLAQSVHYAGQLGPGGQPWIEASTRALLDGYGIVSEGEQLLLRALRVDKACYEVVYEMRMRPDLVHIPLSALDNLLV